MRGGLRFVRRLLLLALVPATSSCLVLSDPDFRGQDECVPLFITHQAQPLVTSRRKIPESPGDPLQFSGTVPLRSCALTKPYYARVFVDGVNVRNQEIVASGTEIRPVEVLVDAGNLPGTCHQVEVFVSSAFASTGDLRTPARQSDLAFILWTFITDADATAGTCGASP